MTWGEYLRGYRATRKAAGICRDCKAPIERGSRCQACRERHAAIERAGYRRRKEEKRWLLLDVGPV